MSERPIPINLNKNKYHEEHKISENREFAAIAGKFIFNSGISDSVIDFRNGFLGDMGEIKNEININDSSPASNASIVLEWIEPNELMHLAIKVTAGRSDNKEKYISASFKEIRHYKGKKHESPSPILQISLLPLGKDFNFEEPIPKNEIAHYKKWLREKILNYEIVWGN